MAASCDDYDSDNSDMIEILGSDVDEDDSDVIITRTCSSSSSSATPSLKRQSTEPYPPPQKAKRDRSSRGSCSTSWCITDNLYSDRGIDPSLWYRSLANRFKDKLRVVKWQLEKGTHTHVQAFVIFENRQFFQTLQLALPGAHFEVMKGTYRQNNVYCTKEESRIAGPWVHGNEPPEATWDNKIGQGHRTDMDDWYTAVTADAPLHVATKHLTTSLKPGYYQTAEKYRDREIQHVNTSEMIEEFKLLQLRPNQQAIWDEIQHMGPDRRHIHWVWSAEGNTGKTYLGNIVWAHDEKNVQYIPACASKDMAQHLDPRKSIFFIDITRTHETAEGKDYTPYALLEQLKNGKVFMGKYDITEKIFKKNIVVVFANYTPVPNERISEDRIALYELKLDN